MFIKYLINFPEVACKNPHCHSAVGEESHAFIEFLT
jgi:hypothetical protein